MNYILTFLGVLLSVMFCKAQKLDSTAFNGAKKIILTNNLTARENYMLAGKLMLENNYSVGLKDSEFFQISTEPVKVSGQGSVHILSIYAVCKDNKITLIGKTKNLTSTKIISFQDQENAYDIMEYKRLNQLSKAVWWRLENLAKTFNGAKVQYSE